MMHALDVTWYVSRPGAPREQGTMRLTDPVDVDTLVALLSDSDVDDAYVTHTGRSATVVPALGNEPLPDHVMHLAVRDGWGYIAFAGPAAGYADGFTGHPRGDPESPGTHGSFNPDYPARTGLPHDVFTKAIAEFLTTAELPTCVDWIAE